MARVCVAWVVVVAGEVVLTWLGAAEEGLVDL